MNPTEADLRARDRAIYASPTKFVKPFEFSLVDARLMAGRNPLSAYDIHVLRRLGVTHLLDLREPKEWAAPRFGLEAVEEAERIGMARLHLPVLDMGAPTPDDLSRAVSHLEEVLAAPGNVAYVHCRAGMERTAAVLICFHAKRHGQSYDDALAELKKGRGILQPLPGQERTARDWLRANGL